MNAELVARIFNGDYMCDILRDLLTQPSIFHWVVQDCSTNEIHGLGQASNLVEAESTAMSFLNNFRSLKFA